MTITTRTPEALIHPMQAGKLLVASIAAIAKTVARRRRVRELSELPDYILSDMGIRRDDIAQALDAPWREDPTYRLAIAAGKRRRGLND